MLVPQGLVVITTLFFALGAASYRSRKVLFQEINATEKLGRIKNLCMDKTGTLTNNQLAVDTFALPPGGNDEEARAYISAYIQGSQDTSDTIRAVKTFIGDSMVHDIAVQNAIPFSSWRRFGAVEFSEHGTSLTVVVGPPDALIEGVQDADQRAWLQALIAEHTRQGQRMLCFARSTTPGLLPDVAHTALTVYAVCTFKSELRPGIQEAVNFFQERGVGLRIISGDHPETVRAVAHAAGVRNTDKVVTGAELDTWTDEEFADWVRAYWIFARISPSQKVRIVDALKLDGFTAMVGDGANDALAIKRADLGIAMFDGAPATRSLAGVVLMNNSFTALPGAVTLADNFIRHIEIFTALFVMSSFGSFFLFLFMSLFGRAFPLLPLNVTVINYFMVGLPGVLIAYWALKPDAEVKKASTVHFLERILPLSLIGGVILGLGETVVYFVGDVASRADASNMLILFSMSIFGLAFFDCIPRVYRGVITRLERVHLAYLALAEIIVAFLILSFPIVRQFFTLSERIPSTMSVLNASAVTLVMCAVLVAITSRYRLRDSQPVEPQQSSVNEPS